VDVRLVNMPRYWIFHETDLSAVAPPQQSKEEIRALEAEANFTVQQAITTAVLLYLCMWNALTALICRLWTPPLTHLLAPFAIELAGKVF
jgi:hypothetical protein